MSNHPTFIDNVAFAKKNEYLEGNLTIKDCPRLSDLLTGANIIPPSEIYDSGLISYTLQGKTDAVGQYHLHLELQTDLLTTCQRCLNTMPLKLALNYHYLIGEVSDTDVEAGDIDSDDDLDLQQASPNMDFIALIEDEIIMAMPIAPIHLEDCGPIVSQSGEKPNSFAVLKGLIKP